MQEPKYKIGDTLFTLREDVKKWEVIIMDVNLIWQVRDGQRGTAAQPLGFMYADKNEGEVIHWIKEEKLFPTKEALINSL